MKGSANAIKVFISYSWSSPQHEEWVLDLARKLYSDGIYAVLDKWDLKEGHDMQAFMEQAVADESIKKVLVVCDSEYQRKANERSGGVGTETQLISKKVYENVKQEKFIPIVKEYTDGKPCIPHFMSSRLYIDLSQDEIFDNGYKKLVLNLYDKAEYERPSLGVAPSYVTDDVPVRVKTYKLVDKIKSALEKGHKVDGYIDEFFSEYHSNLSDFRIHQNRDEHDFDQRLYDTILRMEGLKNSFIDFILIITKYQDDFDIERLHSFFELLTQYFNPNSEVSSWYSSDFDNYRIHFYELILYSVAAMIKAKKYSWVNFLVSHQYVLSLNHKYKSEWDNLTLFNKVSSLLDYNRNNRLGLNRICLSADVIKQSANRLDIVFDDIIQADLLLHYITLLKNVTPSWFAYTSIYYKHLGKIDIFLRLVSKRHFEKIKILLGVETIEELKEKISKISSNNSQTYDAWRFNILSIDKAIDIDTVCVIE